MSTPQSATILPLQYIKGVGPRRAETLAREGIVTPEDVVWRIPRGYVDRTAAQSIAALMQATRASNLWSGEAEAQHRAVSAEVSLIATIADVRQRTVGKGKTMLTVVVQDGSGVEAQLVFWNQIAYYTKRCRVGAVFVISGVPEYDARWNQLTLHHPELEELDEEDAERYQTGTTLPKYTITQGMRNSGITMRLFRTIVEHCLDIVLPTMHEVLPEAICRSASLMNRTQAIRELHQPTSLEHIQRARFRMKYEELFMFELQLAVRRRTQKAPANGLKFAAKSRRARMLVESLPFELTVAQRRVIHEIVEDMTSGQPMNRLLQGDVGSGKTIVALLCMLNAIDNGYQAVLMAPTEILAEQHFHGIQRLIRDLDVCVVNLIGAQTKSARRDVLAQIASGEANIIVGTHAVFESEVAYNKLGLIVIDEQHRFGVAQRQKLQQQGRASHDDAPRTPHVLVMSATPIPRTLSMTLYGDLDVSVIDQLPSNRKPIRTTVVADSAIASVFDMIRREIASGRQAYIVYPLVEKSEKVQAKSAIEHAESLQHDVFPDLRIGIVHGQMSWDEKERVMQLFLQREYDILVATTVIEVGIDVPNATIMVIENAERFGLSQLHQLRGRVGRGGDQSYCYLVTKDHMRHAINRSSNAQERASSVVRLRTMEETTDGFAIAEVDLKLRGPGDVLGVRQSGLPEFRFVDLVQDTPVIVRARNDAFALLDHDPQLQKPEHAATREELIRVTEHKSFLGVA
jgi:ATP-dependent DNA helicase RecG